MVCSLLMWILFGAISGAIANLIVNKKSEGCLFNAFIGITGSVIGGFVFKLLGGEGTDGYNLYSMIVSIVGAIILLGIINWAKRK